MTLERQSHNLCPIQLNLAHLSLVEAHRSMVAAMEALNKIRLPKDHAATYMRLMDADKKIEELAELAKSQRNVISRMLLDQPE